ncbi:MAG TPA: LPS export ABC transporter permease LptF [Gammaproteobacteria bacterium]|nr:LPS export ABC transporter permease LptF [Gammaproteobacteria bacterium]
MLLNRYITAEIIKPMFLGIALLVTVFTGYSLAIKLSQAAQGEVPLSIVARLIGLNSIIAMEVLLPTALYLSIIATLSRFYRDSEMVAMRASGFGEFRVIRSIVLLSVVTSVVVGAISLYARPWAYRQSYKIEAEARAEFDIRKIEPGRFIELQSSKYVLFARGVDKEKGRLKEVFLQSDKGNKIQVTYAREALLPSVRAGETRSFVFHDGYSYLLDPLGSQDTTLKFRELIVPIPEVTKDVSYRRKAEPSASLATSRLSKDIAEYQWRTSTPLATLVLALIAVPLSRSTPRQSRYYSFVVAIMVYVGLFILTSAARNWVADGKIPSFPGLWWVYALPLLLFAGLTGVPALKRWRK